MSRTGRKIMYDEGAKIKLKRASSGLVKGEEGTVEDDLPHQDQALCVFPKNARHGLIKTTIKYVDMEPAS